MRSVLWKILSNIRVPKVFLVKPAERQTEFFDFNRLHDMIYAEILPSENELAVRAIYCIRYITFDKIGSIESRVSKFGLTPE